MTKKIFFIGASVSILAAGAYAQSSSSDEGEALQRQLEERAIRVPAAPPQSTANEDAARSAGASAPRSVPAQIQRRAPNWAEVREKLQETRREDDTRPAPDVAAGAEISLPPRRPPPGLRTRVQEQMADAERREIDRVEVPLLIPAAMRDDAVIYGMRNVYTATTAIDDEASVSITGTCNRVIGGDPDIIAQRRRLAEGPPRLPGLGANYHISRNDFGVDLSFSKFGCGYVITIECNDPAGDQRCAADETITELADSMILVNPERAEAGQ